MKSQLLTLFIIISTSLCAQEAINYQAVVRDNSGNIVTGSPVTFKFSILKGSATGTVQFVETHPTNTDIYGLVNLKIGTGSVVSGTFSSINWGNDKYYLKVEINTGSGFIAVGNTQFTHVPYAIYAETANSSINDSDNQTLSVSGQTLTISGGNSVILPAGGSGDITEVNTGTGLTGGDTTGAVTISAQTTAAIWNANKLRGNTVSTTNPTTGEILKWNGNTWQPSTDDDNQTLSLYGDTLQISGGNSIALPSGGIGDITEVTAGTGLTGGGISGAITVNAQTNSAIWNANKLRGNTIASITPAMNQVLKWNGTAWTPSPDAGGTSYTMGTGLSLSGDTINSLWTDIGGNTFQNGIGRIGIGVLGPPLAKLHVYSATNEDPFRAMVNGSTKFMVHSNGGVSIGYGGTAPPANGLLINRNVGIGIDNPSSRLHVYTLPSTVNPFKVQIGGSIVFMVDSNGHTGIGADPGATQGMNALEINSKINEAPLLIRCNNVSTFRVNDNGRIGIGIGSSAPLARVHIDSEINEDPFRVQINGSTKLMVHDNGGVGIGIGGLTPPPNGLAINDDLTIGKDTSGLWNSSLYVKGQILIGNRPTTQQLPTYTTNEVPLVIKQTQFNKGIRLETNSTGWFGSSNPVDWYDIRVGWWGSTPALRFEYSNPSIAPLVSWVSSANGTWNTVSDRKLKEDIKNMYTVLGKVKSLSPVTYYFRSDLVKEKKSIGFIAQDVEDVFPELVTKNKEGIRSLSYAEFGVIAIKAIQEQQEQIENQATQIEELSLLIMQMQQEIELLQANQ